MITAVVYLVSFVAGPVIFWGLARRCPSRGYFTLLCVIALTLMVAANVVPKLAAIEGDTSAYPALTKVLMLWLGWIVVVALCFLALRERLPPGTAHRGAFAIGAMATTLPWFGLYAAQIVTE
ncbi:hypothetical protein [Roseovarius sp. 2305UL8-3]|uniref:hypothetical protein n=1 Tax=Roseovarius conchicola TaxID=3121636 RepID=UPI0035292EEB